MKYDPITTERFIIYSHEIPEIEGVRLPRTVFQAWFHSMDVVKPVCIVTVNESMFDYVEWCHVEEQYRRQGIATEVVRAINSVVPGLSFEGATDEGEAFVDAYFKRFPELCADKDDSVPASCTHDAVAPVVDHEQLSGMSAEEVRSKFPRFCGTCPQCGETVIAYASFEHFVAGDW